MVNFRATALNDRGDRWQFFFQNENWNGVQQAADQKLASLVAADSLHQKFGPWNATAIDVTV